MQAENGSHYHFGCPERVRTRCGMGILPMKTRARCPCHYLPHTEQCHNENGWENGIIARALSIASHKSCP